MSILTQCTVTRHTHCVSAVQGCATAPTLLEAKPPRHGFETLFASGYSAEGVVPPQNETAEQVGQSCWTELLDRAAGQGFGY